jgi:hypothetical protein
MKPPEIPSPYLPYLFCWSQGIKYTESGVQIPCWPNKKGPDFRPLLPYSGMLSAALLMLNELSLQIV